MGIFLYAMLLIFFLIPVSLRAYFSLKKGRIPLPHFQNNVVVTRIKTRKALGVLSPILFWTSHPIYVLGALSVEAWIAALAAVAYMVVSPMLSAQIKAKGIHVLPEVAGPRGPDA